MCLLDLEDAVAPAEKELARAQAAEAVRDLDWGRKVVAVRINGWGTEWARADLAGLFAQAGARLDEIIVPKVEDPTEVEAVDQLVSELERAQGLEVGSTGLEIQIESARGLSNAAAICESSPRLVAAIFGPADFAASMGISSLGTSWLAYPIFQIAVAARAAGLQVIDGPYFKLHDPDGLEESCNRSASCGYDGKWAVHPEQLPAINRSYTPDQSSFDTASAIVEVYEKALREKTGAVSYEGEMVDEATRKVVARTVARGLQAGMVRTPQAGL
jgi:citrate lyase subunit beta/citryl-CoA lyase